VGLIAAVIAPAVRADQNLSTEALSQVSTSVTASSYRSAVLDDLAFESAGFAFVDTSSGAADVSSDGEGVLRMPESPGSSALFLSAMMSLGAWHLIRSSREFHFGSMPEWYHSGGPKQIGHVTPFNLDFTSLPLCLFDQPIQLRKVSLGWQQELSDRWSSQSQLSPKGSRAPPVAAN
jgi:hypothetical protein